MGKETVLKNTVTIRVSRVCSQLRLESVHTATCGMENARESEDIVGRNFDVIAGSCVPDGGRGRCARAYLQTKSSLPGGSTEERSNASMQAQSGLSGRHAEISHLPIWQAWLINKFCGLTF